METEIEIVHLKRENETLKRENAELKEMNNKLKQSLDEAVRSTRPTPKPIPRRLKPSNSAYGSSSADSELQQLLYETRKQLLNVQERLTVAEQVTAATQRRELVQEHAYENLPPESVYEKLRFDPTQEHVYAKLQPRHTGCIVLLFSVVVVGKLHADNENVRVNNSTIFLVLHMACIIDVDVYSSF